MTRIEIGRRFTQITLSNIGAEGWALGQLAIAVPVLFLVSKLRRRPQFVLRGVPVIVDVDGFWLRLCCTPVLP
jgi:hypothetical protein